jgi:hypothetical protein
MNENSNYIVSAETWICVLMPRRSTSNPREMLELKKEKKAKPAEAMVRSAMKEHYDENNCDSFGTFS